jgi:alkyldihydroxyacetonephosphate synthase
VPPGGRRRSFWGWGYLDQALTTPERDALADLVAARFGIERPVADEPPGEQDLDLPDPRLRATAAIDAICSTDRVDRAAHSHGQSLP